MSVSVAALSTAPRMRERPAGPSAGEPPLRSMPTAGSFSALKRQGILRHAAPGERAHVHEVLKVVTAA